MPDRNGTTLASSSELLHQGVLLVLQPELQAEVHQVAHVHVDLKLWGVQQKQTKNQRQQLAPFW
jgi:hypothetical protein